jgi:hypothetical protein
MVCGHSIHFRYISGQIGMAELNEKVLIGRSKTEMSEQSGVDWNNRNKIEKGAILLQYPPPMVHVPMDQWHVCHCLVGCLQAAGGLVCLAASGCCQ